MSRQPLRAIVRGYRLLGSLGWTPQRLLRRRAPAGLAPVVCTSVPRAGKGLLVSLLCQHPEFRRVPARTVEDRKPGDVGDFARLVHRLGPGQVLGTHLRYSEGADRAIARHPEVRHVFIVRDPRDVAVSTVLYVLRHRRHYLHELFAAPATMKERLRIAVEGRPGSGYDPLGERLEASAGWLARATCVVRFEDLAGTVTADAQGGRRALLHRLFGHLGATCSPDDMACIEAGLRSGAGGEGPGGARWRDHFDDEITELFKRAAGKELVRYGYEEDMDW